MEETALREGLSYLTERNGHFVPHTADESAPKPICLRQGDNVNVTPLHKRPKRRQNTHFKFRFALRNSAIHK